MKIKKEVKDLCIALINADRKQNTDEFNRLENKLKREFGFTTFSLLALFYNPPIMEYGDNQFNLIMEK